MRHLNFQLPTPNSKGLTEAVEVLRTGGVVAYPTETFYGLAVDPRSSDAVRRLFALKGRPETAALTLIAADAQQAHQVAVIVGKAAALAERWWPGPLTIVADARPGLAPETLAGGATVGVRVPNNEIACELARAFGFCITATSANRSGEAPAAHADDVARSLPDVDALLDAGATRGGAPSTIIAVTNGAVSLIREGAIPWERVLESLKPA